MSSLRKLLASSDAATMEEVVAASPRRFREEVFRRLGIKAKAKGFRLASKGDARSGKFQELLQSDKEVEEEIVEEFVRNYLFGRRALLGDALDFLEVEHRDGLTDHELEFLTSLEPEKVERLSSHLADRGHDQLDVGLYLRLMRVGMDRST